MSHSCCLFNPDFEIDAAIIRANLTNDRSIKKTEYHDIIVKKCELCSSHVLYEYHCQNELEYGKTKHQITIIPVKDKNEGIIIGIQTSNNEVNMRKITPRIEWNDCVITRIFE